MIIKERRLVVGLLLMCVSCVYNQGDKANQNYVYSSIEQWKGKKEIIFHNELNIGTEDIDSDDVFFSVITDMAVDEINNLYVLDSKSFRVQLFSSDGHFINSIKLNRGQGPQEYNMPKCIAVNSRNIVIGDMKLMRISVLDKKGVFISSFKTEELPARIEIDHEKLYLTAAFDFGEKRIHVYGLNKGNKMRSFKQADNWFRKNARAGGCDFIHLHSDSTLYFASFYPYEIDLYSVEGELKGAMARLSKLYDKQISENPVTNALSYIIMSGGVDVFSDGKILHHLRSRDIEKKTAAFIFDLFDQKGSWLLSFSSSDLNETWIDDFVIDKEDNIYIATSNPFPRIRKYSLKIRDKTDTSA